LGLMSNQLHDSVRGILPKDASKRFTTLLFAA
jgi:hypothetical protein